MKYFDGKFCLSFTLDKYTPLLRPIPCLVCNCTHSFDAIRMMSTIIFMHLLVKLREIEVQIQLCHDLPFFI